MRRLVKYFGIFSAAAVLSAVLFSSMEADAAFNLRKHASSCLALGGTPIDTSYAVFNNSTTATLTMLCDIEDTASSLKQNTTNLNIHGYDGHNTQQVQAKACYSTYGATGGNCGSGVFSATGRANYTLSPPWSAVWTSSTASDFGYIVVWLPPKDGTNASSLRGFWHTGS